MELRFGFPLACPVADMVALSRAAEAVGCDSVWLSDHLVWPIDVSPTYPYSEDGVVPVPEDVPAFDPWVLLAWIAGQTERIKLGTSVYILPLRDPHVTARAVGTLDVVSGGRAILGAGIGWMPEEFEIAGQPFGGRGRRAEEIVAILRALWSQPRIEHSGAHYRFAPVRFYPKPPQRGDLPILFGGDSEVALRRAARVADGWIGMPQTPAVAAERVRALTALRDEHGLGDRPFEITVGCPAELSAAEAEAFAAAGVDRVYANPWRVSQAPYEALERLATVIQALR